MAKSSSGRKRRIRNDSTTNKNENKRLLRQLAREKSRESSVVSARSNATKPRTSLGKIARLPSSKLPTKGSARLNVQQLPDEKESSDEESVRSDNSDESDEEQSDNDVDEIDKNTNKDNSFGVFENIQETKEGDDIKKRKMHLINVYKEGGKVNRNKSMIPNLNASVRKAVLSHVKFTDSKKGFGTFEQPDFTSNRCWINAIFKEMRHLRDATDREKAEYWVAYRSDVRTQFQQYRSTKTKAIKNIFMKGEFANRLCEFEILLILCANTVFIFRLIYRDIEMETRIDKDNCEINYSVNDPMKSIVKEVTEGRGDCMRFNLKKDEFKMCAEICMIPMVERSRWRANHKKVPLSQIVTVSDEAFGVLVMENNLEDWIAEITPKKEGEEPHKRGSLCKYTKPVKLRGGAIENKGVSMNRGWSIEGRERYNKIYDIVKEQRGRKRSADKETWMMNQWSDETGNTDGKRKQMTAEETEMKKREDNYVPRVGFYD